ncbi:toxin-antitoxin system HicB family antitoxin [Treponema sp. OMZ 840]|uniref:toxin-antitoxin system HicB family antitoxin n=1 Tax=Treponema sp. OMZ 840 TaxID=244313 RepID=UPI003D8C463C
MAVNTMTIRIPKELKERIENTAVLQGVSINQFAVYAFTKELSEMENSRYFTNYLKNQNREDIIAGFDTVMNKITDREVESWDTV